ncbi:class I SAM-dependent methyltransferase [Alcaligenes sp. HNGD-HTN06]|uniref:class I SAM-dependent methyltransferase n=1 Tax=Alcaligenes sp. HNGD-HTN06 TaxID=3416924 RepID=UPI003CF0BC47
MERLDMVASPQYPNIEAAIHLARYSAVLPYVRDKVVLDLACGEGYGSALLKMAGARRVIAADVSVEAVEKSRTLFSEVGVEYLQADAHSLAEQFGSDYFDVVVSIETIEHVPDDSEFLSLLKQMAKPDAVFYITCPNDHWYFEPDQSNPYHLRKYTFEQFEDVATGVLGTEVQWSLGTAVFGFGAVPKNQENDYESIGQSWMQVRSADKGFAIPNKQAAIVNTENCSYYAGIWNLPEKASAAASYFAVDMDAYLRMFDAWCDFPDQQAAFDHQIQRMSEHVTRLQGRVADLSQENRHMALLMAAIRSENEALRNTDNSGFRDRIAYLEEVVSTMESGYWRYTRMSRMVPGPLKRILMGLKRVVKG